ncbi:MAG TPA: FkbM family methyltransferase [Gemmatimonadales bacterium]|nr:FkbM family methyltransferase [Gemmatimonadales bacterium]
MLSGETADQIKRVLKYMYRFGSVRGPRMLLQFRSRNASLRLRLPGYEHPIFLRTGTSDVPTFEQVFVSLEYDFPYPNAMPRLIIDAGANVGFATLFFARRFPNARVLAVEPDRSNYELLLRNTQRYPQVTPIRAALWPQSVPLKIDNPNDPHWAFRVSEARDDPSEVRGVTVSELMVLAGTSTIDILKLDIEGAEKEVFESRFEPWMDKVKVIVVELHDGLRAGCSTAFYRAMSRLRFSQFICGEHIVLIMEH